MKKILILSTMFVSLFLLGTTDVAPPIPLAADWQHLRLDAPHVFTTSKLIKNDTLAFKLGQFFFTRGCESCHNIDKAGFSNTKDFIGGGGKSDRYLHDMGLAPEIKLDTAPIRSPKVANTKWFLNTLSGGELGTRGFNDTLDLALLTAFKNSNTQANPLEAQADVALGAHNVAHIVGEAQAIEGMEDVARAAFHTRAIDDQLVNCALAFFQSKIQTDRAPFQRWLRGEIAAGAGKDQFRDLEGFALFVDKGCTNCHNGPALGGRSLARKLGGGAWRDTTATVTGFAGRSRMTGADADKWVVMTRGLYNLKDAPCALVDCEDLTVYKTIKRHAKAGEHHPEYGVELTTAETWKLARFVGRGLHDGEMDRWMK